MCMMYFHAYMQLSEDEDDIQRKQEVRAVYTVCRHTYIHTVTYTYIHTYIHTYIPPCCTQQLASDVTCITVHTCDTWWCSGVRILHVKLSPLFTYFLTATASPQWTVVWRWSDRLWWLLQWWYHLSFSSSTYPSCETHPQTHPHYIHMHYMYLLCVCSVWSLLSPQRRVMCLTLLVWWTVSS